MAKTSAYRLDALPYWPLMLDEAMAAAYCSLTIAAFRSAVDLRQLPLPQTLAGQPRWSRIEIDACRDRTGHVRSPDVDPIAAAIANASKRSK